jgi:hypothetical protein
MAERKNPSAQAIDAVLDEYRGIRKRSRSGAQESRRKKAMRPISPKAAELNPIMQRWKQLGIDPADFRERP